PESTVLPHLRHFSPASAVAGRLLADGEFGWGAGGGGVNDECSAEKERGFPQSRQNREAGSFSWPQNSHVAFADAGIGEEVGGGRGVIAHSTRGGRTA